MGSAGGKRSDFHRQPVTPSIFAIGDCSDLVPQFAIGVTVEHTRRSVDPTFPDMDRNLAIAPDVLDPPGRFTRFGKQVKTLTPDHEPNLDLAGRPVLRPTVVSLRTCLSATLLRLARVIEASVPFEPRYRVGIFGTIRRADVRCRLNRI